MALVRITETLTEPFFRGGGAVATAIQPVPLIRDVGGIMADPKVLRLHVPVCVCVCVCT